MKKIVSFICMIGMIVVSFAAHAQSDNLYLTTTIASYHFDRDNDYCETNTGVGMQYNFMGTVYVTTGSYKNSYCKSAPYLFVGGERNFNQYVGVGIMGGLVGGYTDKQIATQPLAAIPYIRIGSNDSVVHAKVAVMPSESGFVGLQLNWRLW